MTLPQFLHRLRLGAYHQKGGILSLDCGPVANFDLIAMDVQRLVREYPGVNAMDGKLSYVQPEGEYTVHSLLTATGEFDDMESAWGKSHHRLHPIAGHGMPAYKRLLKRFHHPETFPHLAEFISKFPEAINFTIKTFKGKSSIEPHEERIFHRHNGKTWVRIRLHLPIATLPEAYVIVRDRQFKYEPGRLYYLNNSEVHYAVNRSEGERIHLIWDCILTERLYQQVFSRACEQYGIPLKKRHRYHFNTWPGKLPQWTQPWFWNNLQRWAEFHLGKVSDAQALSDEEARSL